MARLALDLMDAGHEVSKVAFCVPDFIYRLKGIRVHVFHKPFEDFADWLESLVRREGYDAFFVYNHLRPYNQVAWDLAERMDLECQVFEQGLIRPNFVTVFRQDQLPRTELRRRWEGLLEGDEEPELEEDPKELSSVSTPVKTLIFVQNFILCRITAPLFPHFVDQRELGFWHHLKHAAIHLWRFMLAASDVEYDRRFAGDLSGRFYAVPLQVESDTQITHCSDYDSIADFMTEVVDSFERHAPEDALLVFKMHPVDRGYADYTDLIMDFNQRFATDRILYVDRVHLPTLLTHARGVVNINSSVGISALVHDQPVMAMGRAVYNLPELTYQGDLDSFWQSAPQPDHKRVEQFVKLLRTTSQGRGTLFQRCFDVPGRCRIRWPKPFRAAYFGD